MTTDSKATACPDAADEQAIFEDTPTQRHPQWQADDRLLAAQFDAVTHINGSRGLRFGAAIGSGRILDAAIEINEGKNLRDNLEQWQVKYVPQSRTHSRRLDARENRADRAVRCT